MANRVNISLVGKKDLILHTYDSFLISQTRLFSRATSNKVSASDEIARRSELLLLDDLIAFAIAARRLVELTKLKSFANRFTIPLAFLDNREEPYVVGKSNQSVGFHTLMNRMIHASIIDHYDNMLKLKLAFTRLDKEIRDKIIFDQYGREDTEPFEQLLFIVSDDSSAALVSLLDVINTSIEVSDKIIETCSQESIFLELSLRGAD
jgi:hypothetical protein